MLIHTDAQGKMINTIQYNLTLKIHPNPNYVLIPKPSPPKLTLFQRPEQRKTNRAKRKRQLEPDVAPVHRIPNLLAYGTDEPHLRHAHDGAKGPEAECQQGGDAGREEAWVVPDADVVFALFEDEVLG